MSEELQAKFHRLVDEAWNKGNLDALDELHTVDYIEHRPPFADIQGLDAFKQYVADVRQAYPDFHLTIHESMIAGDRIATRWSWTGTHLGQSPALAIPPTGKQLTVSGGQILHLQGNKLAECWQFADNLGAMQQLGLIPVARPA